MGGRSCLTMILGTVLGGLGLVAAIALLSSPARSVRVSAEAPPTTAIGSTIPGPGTAPSKAEPEGPTEEKPAPVADGQRAALLEVARRFAGAYLKYQVGATPYGVQRTLYAACTPAFARQLIASPVSVPPDQAHAAAFQPARLGQVTYVPPAGPGLQIVTARYSNREGAHGVLRIQIQATAGGWKVAGLG